MAECKPPAARHTGGKLLALYGSQASGEAELLQLRAVCKGRAQYFDNALSRQVNDLQLLATRTGGRSHPIKI